LFLGFFNGSDIELVIITGVTNLLGPANPAAELSGKFLCLDVFFNELPRSKLRGIEGCNLYI